jgi:hypothetical protein
MLLVPPKFFMSGAKPILRMPLQTLRLPGGGHILRMPPETLR